MAKKKRKKLAVMKPAPKSEIKAFLEAIKPVKPDDEFSYQCSLCGDCCRNVKEAVMLESLDVFRIARYFSKIGNPMQAIEEILTEYTTPVPLTDLGYPIFLLNTTGPKDECVFLKSGKCSVQPAKPRTCRLYPLSVEPNDSEDSFNYVIVSQKQHHFTGPKIRVGDWMADNFSAEDREFTLMEYKLAGELGRLMRKLKEKGVDDRRMLFPIMLYKYFDFDLDAPFMPQYRENIETLKSALTGLIKG